MFQLIIASVLLGWSAGALAVACLALSAVLLRAVLRRPRSNRRLWLLVGIGVVSVTGACLAYLARSPTVLITCGCVGFALNVFGIAIELTTEPGLEELAERMERDGPETWWSRFERDLHRYKRRRPVEGRHIMRRG